MVVKPSHRVRIHGVQEVRLIAKKDNNAKCSAMAPRHLIKESKMSRLSDSRSKLLRTNK